MIIFEAGYPLQLHWIDSDGWIENGRQQAMQDYGVDPFDQTFVCCPDKAFWHSARAADINAQVSFPVECSKPLDGEDD